MDTEILKKKLSTYKSPKGRIRNVSDDLSMEVLAAWENWSGSASSFYSAIGAGRKSMASILGKAKRLKRAGYESSGFEEIKIESGGELPPGGHGIELVWDNNRVLRFESVDMVVDFLKKAA